uniref:MFS domain-containing protein n=1 Tax=Steinernema glaseri TaxID=37863 RepID=A0A1I7YMM1_9BILA
MSTSSSLVSVLIALPLRLLYRANSESLSASPEYDPRASPLFFFSSVVHRSKMSAEIEESRTRRSSIERSLRLVKKAFLNISVEPIIFFVYIGWVFGNTLQSPGLYRRICETYYGDDPKVHCRHLTTHFVEDKVQIHSAEWSLYSAICYLTPAVFADTILGAYGDKYGRQVNILIGIAGIAFSEFGFMLTISQAAHTPYWTVLLFGLTTGATGYIALVPVSCNAYLADITTDSDLLTIKSSMLIVAQQLASIIGGAVAAALSGMNIPLAVDVEIALYVVAFVYTLWRIPQRPGYMEQTRKIRGNTLTSIKSSRSDVTKFFSEIWQLLKEGFVTYTRKRVGHRRAFMFITAIVLMLTYTTAVETRTSPVMNTYVFRRTSEQALAWTSRDIGYWNASGFFCLIVGTVGGIFVFKKIFRFRETTLILIALVSSSIRTVVIAFATKGWHMYAANVCGLFSGLVQPAVVSFITQLVPYEETGRAFSLFGIGGDLAFIISNLVYSNVYRGTVAWMPGFLFLFIGLLQLLAGLAMLWVHFCSAAEGVGRIDQSLNGPRDIQRAISTLAEEHDENSSQMAIFTTGERKISKKKSTALNIYDHALERRLQKQNSAGFWESLTDVRRDRNGSFY